MNEQQVDYLLEALTSAFPTLKMTESIAKTWHFALFDENPEAIFAAARHLLKTRDSAFMPSISELIRTSKGLASGSFQTADQAWAEGPNCKDPHGAKVWKAWGGQRRFGALPDPKYCDDPASAQTTLSFARKEFCDLYESMRESEIHEQAALSHDEAVAFLGGKPKPRLEVVR